MSGIDLAFFFAIVLCLTVRSSGIFIKETPGKCGYESCHPTKDGYVNVHLIPHSHDDVGWVKTVDQFFYGTKSYIYRAGVVHIYDDVLKSVQKKKDRRFIYVETAFFWKWWREQEEPEKNALKELVDNGQIEFIGGGWSMNDEAVTNYQSIIDQMTWGLKKLNDSLGECARPKMGWQIDPFGHSSEMASIFAQLGYDGVILGRIDFEDKRNRLKNRNMEMVWRGSNNLGRKTDIFTSVLYNHYDAPAGFCFDILCDDDPLVDDLESAEYNIEMKFLRRFQPALRERFVLSTLDGDTVKVNIKYMANGDIWRCKAEEFVISHVQDSLSSFQTSNVIVPMGRDFAYQEAEAWFRNIDKLIKYVNNKETFNNTKYHLLYSTPSCYAAAVRRETEGVLSSPLKVDDFLPYGTDPHAYWTGYYTSRPTLKRYERMGNNFLQICKQLYALTSMPSEYQPRLNSLREAMGVMQHHDAVTGTEKEEVAYDYARLLHIGMTNCENVTGHALSSLTSTKTSDFQICLLTNVSQCALSEDSETFVVTVYNPLSRSVNKYVRLPVFGTSYSVTDPHGNTVRNQIIPTATAVKNILGRKSNTSLELVFEAEDVPPLGFKSFYIKSQPGNDVTEEDLSLFFRYANKEGVEFDVDPSTGLISKIQINDVALDIDQKFWYYNGSNGWEMDSRASGAYIFSPDCQYPIEKVSDTARFEVYRGDIVTEVHQTFSDYVSQIVRIYENEKFIEFDWLVGPVDLSEGWAGVHGKEIISRFTTPLKSDSTFYTDSNGREMMKRIRNFRPTWDITVNQTESSNYYPVTSKIAIRDEGDNLQFAVLTDRAQGGSSLENGEVELMLLRNTVNDDRLGVGEALIEIAYDRPIIARGSHYVTLGHMQKTHEAEQTIAAIEHEIASRKLLDSWIYLSVPSERTFEEYKASHSMKFSGLKTSLPNNVHVMTLEPWGESSYLLRLEHSFEKGQDPVLSQPVAVDIDNLFTTFEIKSLEETTLGGNQWLKDNERLSFRSAFQSDDLDLETNVPSEEPANSHVINLEPIQIRTFIIEIQPRSA